MRDRPVGPQPPKPWESTSFEYPPSLPTMISLEEKRYLYWLGRNVWTGKGAIVEIGPWLGGSTYCLASGMRANPTARGPKLHVYDSFEWRSFMSKRAPLPLREGESFLPYFMGNLEPFAQDLEVVRCVLPDEALPQDRLAMGVRHTEVSPEELFHWGGDERIEILFIDGAKSWSGMLHLLSETAPSLIPGTTLLVCQDYKHWGCYWVPAITELLSEYLTPLHVLRHNTVAFLLRRPLERETVESLPQLDEVSDELAARLFRSCRERLLGIDDHEGAAVCRLAEARCAANRGATGDAVRLFRAAEREWPRTLASKGMDEARRWLEEVSGDRLAPSLAWRSRGLKSRLRNRARRLVEQLRRHP